MVKDAASAGFYESPNGKKFPRVQLLTIGDLLEGKARAEHPDYEPDLNFKKAKQEKSGDPAIAILRHGNTQSRTPDASDREIPIAV